MGFGICFSSRHPAAHVRLDRLHGQASVGVGGYEGTRLTTCEQTTSCFSSLGQIFVIYDVVHWFYSRYCKLAPIIISMQHIDFVH